MLLRSHAASVENAKNYAATQLVNGSAPTVTVYARRVLAGANGAVIRGSAALANAGSPLVPSTRGGSEAGQHTGASV